MTGKKKKNQRLPAPVIKISRIHIYKNALMELLVRIRSVRGCRQMNAAESPETQDAWDYLNVAVIEAERALDPPAHKKSVDKKSK